MYRRSISKVIIFSTLFVLLGGQTNATNGTPDVPACSNLEGDELLLCEELIYTRYGVRFLGENNKNNQSCPTNSEGELNNNGGSLTNDGNPFHTLAYPPISNKNDAIGAINKFIADYGKANPFIGLGDAFIAGAKRANVNPYLAVAHLYHESGFATAPDGWHKTTPPSHNAFGRSATASQPHTIYHGSRDRLVYQWPSWRASLDDPSGDDWFSYIKRQYLDQYKIPSGDFASYVHKYAPKSDGNNEQLYVSTLLSTIDKLVSLSKDPAIGNYSSSSCNAQGIESGGVADIAKKELGVKEGSDRMLEYTAGNNEKWCADFVSWVFKSAGKPFSGGSSGGWRIPAVVTLRSYFQSQKDGSSYHAFNEAGFSPQPGDVAFWNPSVYSHVGIVVAVGDGTITLVSGNWGNQVYLHTGVANNGSTILGFGRTENAQ